MIKKMYIFVICTILSTISFSQKIQKEKSPKKAALYSAILPGAGQVYTKKYWKVPIVYGGIVTSFYFINENNSKYIEYREAALLSNETGENQLGYNYSELKTLKEYYRRNRDVSYFIFVGVYILNIVDASVNAHLFSFDVSDDISMNIQPYSTLSNTGLALSFNF
ncbi:MAG: hypothetical protein CMD22_02755 [Flavobacteriales bacterium]|nr:hypothetical protein [Flavobacteriales bacterium]